MMHGDISNQVRATFGFMCEDFLIEYKDNTVKDKLLNFIVGKTKRAEINPLVVSSMEYIYRQTEYNVDLLVSEEKYSEFQPIITNLPFNRVVLYNKYSQISSRLLTGDLTYVIDNDDYRRGLFNSQYAITLSDLDTLIKRGGRHSE